MEAIAAGAAANVSSEAAKGIFHEAKRHIRYVIIYDKNVEKFKDKLETMIAKQTSVQQDVDVARRNGEEIKADVQEWRNRVDKAITEKKKEVTDLEIKARSKCFSGLCPNIMSRYRLSRKAEEAANTFDGLINECQFDHVGFRDVPKARFHTDFQTFESRKKVLIDIMESLKNSTVRMIGIYGMPGVGKTYIVREVYRQVQGDKSYDSVVMVTVSQKPDIQRIQDEIAESLGLKLEEKSTVGRARRLCERLIQEKMILIILDDIWEKLDLDEVGIPFGSQHEGCKILLTSRNKNVVSNVMGATNTFQLGDLDDEEAWEFFKKMAGDSVERADLRPTATEVAKRCAGLPLAISTVARALQNKELFVWKEALRQLQRPYSEIPSEISAEVYSAIELSINHLRGEDLKQTFLLCSLLRRNARIEDLLRYAIGLGLINGVDTLQEARDRLLTMMSTLKASCLLRDHNINNDYFDVHDLTYIVAKSIASKDNQVFALKEDDDLWDWPNDESMKKFNKICLPYPSINNFPDQLNCPQLFLFFLLSKDRPLTLPDDFFKEATKLKVLNLTSMQFSSLPSSICLLTGLSMVCLDHCKLGEDITIIGGLKSLEILSIMESDIKILPKEIGQLVKLKLLDVTCCAKLKIISDGVLSSLSRLEELYMGGTSIQWGQSSTASLAELNTLSRLSTLQIQIPDAKAVPRDFLVHLQKLESYKIFIGKEWEGFGNQYSRILKLRLSTSIDDLDCGIKKLKKVEDLHLDGLKGAKIALQELTDEENLLHLKNLHIQNGLDTKYIMNDKNEFPQLQSLTLKSLPQLINFCSHHKTGGTSSLSQHELLLFSEKVVFKTLRVLIIEGCSSLKCILSASMALDLVQLKEITVRNCPMMKYIIKNGAEKFAMDTVRLPRLETIKLESCSELISFYIGSITLQCPSLIKIDVRGCPKMYAMACTKEEGGGEKTPFFNDKVVFKNLKVLVIEGCKSLKSIFSVSMTLDLMQLKDILVMNCPIMEYIIKKGAEEIAIGTVSLPKLETIRLNSCSELTSFCMGSVTLQCPSLIRIAVLSCPKIYAMVCTREGGGGEKTPLFNAKRCKNTKAVIFTDESTTEAEELILFTKLATLNLIDLPSFSTFWHGDNSNTLFNQKVVFPNLKNLSIQRIGKCWKIWHDEATMDSFYELTHLCVQDCGRLLNIFPCDMVERLEKLQTLVISGCGSLQEIIRANVDDRLHSSKSHSATGTSTQSMDIKSNKKFVFPKVRELTLARLPQLKCFYSKLHTTEWPSLKLLKVSNCIKVETFAKEYINFQETQGDRKTLCSVQQILFWVTQETFHNLEKLDLMWNGNLMEIWHGALPNRYFCNLTSLRLTSVTIPNSFIQSLSNLEKLSLRTIAMNGLVPCKGLGDEDEHAGTRDKLTELRWSQLSLTQVLCNLETLQALGCNNSVSFKYLTTLKVSECQGFRNLVTFTTAKSMAQLTTMSVTDCQMLKEIIASTTDEATDDIVFSQLKSLELVNLSSLSRFCSGKYTLLFPSLEEVIIRQCPKIKFFTEGKLSTPMLHGLQSTKGEYVGRWEGDLNVILQQLFVEKGFPSLEDL